jgi:hypothetical protein
MRGRMWWYIAALAADNLRGRTLLAAWPEPLCSSRPSGKRAICRRERFVPAVRRHAVYLLSACSTLFAPLALLPWNVAKTIWILCSLGAFLWGTLNVGRMAGGLMPAPGSFLLAFAPVHTAFARGQPGILVFGLIAASLALALQQTRKLISACLTVLLLSGVAVIPLKTGTLAAMVANLTALSAVSGVVQGVSSESLEYQLININILIPHSLYTGLFIGGVYVVTGFTTHNSCGLVFPPSSS